MPIDVTSCSKSTSLAIHQARLRTGCQKEIENINMDLDARLSRKVHRPMVT
ncbi:predicted protein [Sclerotinia sclerotiorum 1980 UF-70]|uniref:Uncharacterized protein n=1 Tax=Sclerotinia sclerotiorum (strain ATCC 18683 / 1980 / Ss-1) TaxID=665079 RepID=A7ECX6_SCLS1|nr:predicted protein [Sclerotinia sclerotiorum 1980 UF-70]EDO00692.1 predicted protein [Sclerotinia sclerotiorum 1980 UF-70]